MKSVLPAALAAIRAEAKTPKLLAQRTLLSISTCRKIFEDLDGSRGYHWSTIEYTLILLGLWLTISDETQERRSAFNGCVATQERHDTTSRRVLQ